MTWGLIEQFLTILWEFNIMPMEKMTWGLIEQFLTILWEFNIMPMEKN